MDWEELWWSVHSERRDRQRRIRAAMVDLKLGVKRKCKGERNGGRESY
jgi:hypothetical protein